MKDVDIIIALRDRLKVPVGRHLYGVLGTYNKLEEFDNKLQSATMANGKNFPASVSVNQEIINAFSDDEFRDLVMDEAKRPEPTRASLKNMFEKFLRERLSENGVLVLKDLELLFVYNIDLSLLRVLSIDQNRIILLLPGKRSMTRIAMYPGAESEYRLPQNLIADNHVWELKG